MQRTRVAIIAAHAHRLGLTLVKDKTREFRRVSPLDHGELDVGELMLVRRFFRKALSVEWVCRQNLMQEVRSVGFYDDQNRSCQALYTQQLRPQGHFRLTLQATDGNLVLGMLDDASITAGPVDGGRYLTIWNAKISLSPAVFDTVYAVTQQDGNFVIYEIFAAETAAGG